MTDQLSDTGLEAGAWALDPAHTTIGFTARHLMSKVQGHLHRGRRPDRHRPPKPVERPSR